MSSPSFTPASPSTSQRHEAASTKPNSEFQIPNNLNAAVVAKTLGSNFPDDPTERSTGVWQKVMNEKWYAPMRPSVLQAELEFSCPDLLEYYEDRRTGKIEAKSFEDWGEPVSLKEEHKLYGMEHGKTKGVFFEVDYNRGFTGRGGELASCAHTLLLLTDEIIVLPETMDKPGLLGPRNEKINEIPDPAGGLSYEQADRSLWQAVDKSGCPSGFSKDVGDVGPSGEARDDEDVGPFGETRDDEEVGPLGETRDDEDVGPLGETRDGDDGLRQDYDYGEQQEEEGKVTDDEDMDSLVQLAAKTGSIMSEMPENTGTPTTFFTASSTESSTSLTSSSHTLSSTPATTSRKRTRNSKEDAKDDESPSQQKRRRMDNALEISKKDANTINNAPSIGAAITPDGLIQQSRKRPRDSEEDAKDDESPSQQKRRRMDDVLGISRKDTNAGNNAQAANNAQSIADVNVQQSRKRARNSDDDTEESTTRPGPNPVRLHLKPPKHVRLHLKPPKPLGLYVRPKGDANNEEAHVADAAPKKDESMVVHQPNSSNDVQTPVTVDKVTSVEVDTQASVEEVPFANGETNKNDDAAAYDKAAPWRKEWNTAHGINSNSANIPVRVFDLDGEEVHFYLPTSGASSPYRPLTQREKEDLRVYIQDYGIQDWHVLAKSMNKTVRGLKTEYLEYIVARNRKAGRRDLAGIPSAWPDLAPPPPPPPLPPRRKSGEQTAAQDSADPGATSEPAKPKLSVKASNPRARAQMAKAKNNNLGDLKYDLKAKSFPRITKDGGMIDAKGNALLGIMDKIPAQSFHDRRQN